MDSAGSLKRLSPAELRLLMRQNDPRITITSGLAKGYQQAGVIFLPNQHADDFEAFCHNNPGPLTFLYRSQQGESSCPPLAGNVDIRTDISKYCVYEAGHVVRTLSSLMSLTCELRTSSSEQQPVAASDSLSQQLSDMVCLYLGCSFGFESKLKDAGVPVRNVEQGKNVSMYKSTVPCVPVGVFSCPLVVTMRPIPAALLNVAVEVTHLNPLAHGAPVHIGEPALLGIPDLSRPDYGDPVELQPGDVPVFWACGVTAIQAILSSKVPLAFSHSPGCMFLTDIPDSSTSIITPTPNSDNPPNNQLNPELTPLSFLVSHNPLLYSLVSRRAVAKIRHLEMIIGEDPGEEGTKDLFSQKDLLHSCLALSHSRSVAVTTGVSTHHLHSSPDQIDGWIPGAIAIANMLLSLGKTVTLITDSRFLEMTKAIVDEAVNMGVLNTATPLLTVEDSSPNAALDLLCHHGDTSKPRYDHIVAVECRGTATDRANVREENVKHQVGPVEELFITAQDISGITTTGVSNWGGYAVACGLFLLNTCPSHQRYLKRGLGKETTTSQEQLQDWTDNLPSVEKEQLLRSTLMQSGLQNGKSGNSVAGALTFTPDDNNIITRLLKVIYEGSMSEN
ncbi:D-glutamate cyclase, mitochondrial-like isoform X2 [Cynoglossus semilaevis]|uniref:D-glutamate cyclase, mitochondrial-like isoform X2 n=1 Tax=Cynoglossus semilaevis TaxID=244447 RepID=UPI000496FA3F|nr:D-glutamate cyclase, mitochondrial-like isoform X2 [Cynoglossus semilaevis]